MIPYKHRWPRSQVLFAYDNLKAHTGGKTHGEFECAGGSPLGDAVVADETEEDGGKEAITGTDDETGVGSEEAGVEGGSGVAEGGHGEEGGGEAEVEGEGFEEDGEDKVHF